MKKYYRRAIEEAITEAAQSFPCVTLYGPRQVGKSTTLQYMYGNDMRSISLDDAEELALAKENPKLFLQTYGWPLVIDEIQKAPELMPEIKIQIDRQRLEWLRNEQESELMYILTGSSQFELKEAVTESLAGRTAILNMSSFSMSEKEGLPAGAFNPDIKTLLEKEKTIGHTPKTRREIFENIIEGGMPDVVSKTSKRDTYFRAYLSTYIEKDVRQVISASYELEFLNFMSYVALRTAQELNIDEISRSVGIDSRTCKRWLSILESSGIITLLQPYLKNASKRIVKSPKLYFMDTGLCAYLCKWHDAEMLEKSSLSGAFYETFVVGEIVKSLQNSGLDAKHYLYYYRDKAGKEIDLIYEKAEGIYPIEIKKGVRPENPAKNFDVLNQYPLPVMPGLIIDSAEHIRPLNDKVYICPVGMLAV